MENQSLPNFLIIGAPRCGTDFLSFILKQHPDVCFSSQREVHFFDRNFDKGMEWYQSFFNQCNKPLIGEKTANYLIDETCAKKIQQRFPDIKLIVSLRNPVLRAFSHYTNWLGKGALPKKMSFRNCLKQHLEIIDIGYYYRFIEKYYKLFPKENILVLFFEDLIAETHLEMNKVWEFLDIENFNKFTINKKNQSPPLSKLNILHGQLGRILYKYIFSKINQKYLKSIYYANQSIKKEDYAYLNSLYLKENERLFRLINKKNAWND